HLDDQDLLARIALRDTSRMVRYRAVNALSALSAQSRLEDIALEDRNGEMRDLVIPLITDSARLLDIARRAGDSRTRQLAFSRMKDKDLLAKLAAQDSEKSIRLAAV